MVKVTPRRGKVAPTVAEATQGEMVAVDEDAIAEIPALMRENASKILPSPKIITSDKQSEDMPKRQHLPKESVRELLTDEARKPEKTIEHSEKLERGTDGSTLGELLCYTTQVLPTTLVPKVGLDKGGLHAAFKARYEAMNTMPVITKDRNMCLDWNAEGVYRLNPDGNKEKSQVLCVKVGDTANLPSTIGDATSSSRA